MKTVVTRRNPRGQIIQPCGGCGRLFRYGQQAKRDPIVIVNTFTNRGEWRSVECYHADCFEE